jgi:hypothetical protein
MHIPCAHELNPVGAKSKSEHLYSCMHTYEFSVRIQNQNDQCPCVPTHTLIHLHMLTATATKHPWPH